MLTFSILLLVGCGSKDKSTEEKIDDVLIRQNGSTSYFNYNGKTYACGNSLIVGAFNGYQCVDTDIEYDEESDTYTCVIKFKRIIKQ